MRVWRICRRPYAVDLLAGRGGLLTSGRWHTRGRHVVYTSGSVALAALEVLVHVDKAALPLDLLQLEINAPDSLRIMRIEVDELPPSWKSHPALPTLQRRGDDWLKQGSTSVLQVPSAVIPDEFNFLLNPQHDEARSIQVTSSRDFSYDPRLFQARYHY